MRGSIRMSESIAWSIFAFLSGGIVGAMVMERILMKRYKQSLERARVENQRLSEDLESSMAKRLELLDGMEDKVDQSLASSPRRKTDYSNVRPLRKSKAHKALASVYQDPDREEDEFNVDPDVEQYLAEREAPPEDKPVREPFEITAEQFELDFGAIDADTLSYYQEDGALVDSRDVIILEPSEIVGEDGMDLLASTKEPTIYFHNDAHDMNYEVDVLHGMNYRRDVLGAIDNGEGLAGDDE